MDDDDVVLVALTQESVVTASAWIKGISLSVLASIIGGASKLAIRKSWLMEQQQQQQQQQPMTSTANETMFDDVHSSATGDVDGSVRYSQIANDREIDILQTPSYDDTQLALQQDQQHHDHYTYGSSNQQPGQFLPVLLRTCGMIGMTALNPLCSVLAMNYASPSILAPFSGLTLVWIVLFSEILVGEKPSMQQVIAAALIVLGEVIIAIFGDHTNDVGRSIEDVIHSYSDTGFLLFIITMSVWMTFLLHYMCISSAKANTSPTFQRFAWGVAGGSITGFQNFLKDSLTILKSSSNNKDSGNDNDFPYLLFTFMFGMAIATALTGLIILTLCMKRYDVTYSASMFVGSFCISASIMSAIHYNTFSHLNDIVNYIGYPTGLFILLYGVYLLISTMVTSSVVMSSRSDPVSMTFVEPPLYTEDNELS